MKHLARLLACVFALGAIAASAQPFGIPSRTPNSSLLINDLPSAAPGTMNITRAFPSLTFSQPVFMAEAPDGSGRLFVLEKEGVIKVFNKANPTVATVALDISAKTATDSEEGLLGLAFDPNYATNGVIYISYVQNNTDPGTSRISRLVNSPPSSNVINPASEQVLLSLQQPFTNHNGGMIAFGPDNMLYISFGDGGSGGDPGNRAQNTTVLFGKILRIDVHGTPDAGLAYRIPPDNPFVNGGPGGASTRKEIWSYGMRNPWRFSFDKQNGRLFCGDVGQGTYEEVDIIEKGKNYGWRIMEGLHCFNPSSGCDQTGITLPIVEYDHSFGDSITGGYVYYGTKLPSLYGMYIYADYGSGRVWGLRYNGTTVDGPFVLVNGSGRSPSAFCQDLQGEIFIMDVANGGVYELTPAAVTPSDFPTKLSAIPALLAAGKGQDQTSLGIIPYEPSSKLWSDGTLKSRFIAIPSNFPVIWAPAGGWTFPDKSILIKNFSLPADERQPQSTARRIETRILYRRNGQWNGFSYEWNEAQTDADLLIDGKFKNYTVIDKGGQQVSFDYRFPSRQQCNICHTSTAGGVLGLNTPQMNFNFHYPASGVTDNQLRTLDHIGFFSSALPSAPAQLPAMPDSTDPTAALNARARAYLAANCAQCHRPGGTAPSNLDFRWEAANNQMNAIGVAPNSGDLGILNPHIITPHDPATSVLLSRVSRRDQFQMPPLATQRVDRDGVALITAWIGILSNQNGAEAGRYYK